MGKGQDNAANGVCYHSTCKLHYHADIGSYIASGVAALAPDGKLLAALEDVSQDHEWVERLVRRLNRGQADPGQLRDIVFDAISEPASV